ncbi:hypothetical protein D1007_13138 [Hordeum vulgare]|nr:hypothetical protein D1007_13138 [Hordeum vulgare]
MAIYITNAETLSPLIYTAHTHAYNQQNEDLANTCKHCIQLPNDGCQAATISTTTSEATALSSFGGPATSARQMGHRRLLRSHEPTHSAWNPCSHRGSTMQRSPAMNASRHTAHSPAPPSLKSWHGSSPSSSAVRPASSSACSATRAVMPRLSTQRTTRMWTTSISVMPAASRTTESTMCGLIALAMEVPYACEVQKLALQSR